MRKLGTAMAIIAGLTIVNRGSVAGIAEIAPPPVPNVTIVPPSTDALAAAYPASAKGRNQGGNILLMCTIRPDESADCRVTQWTPGFDQTGNQIGQLIHVKSNDQASHAGETFDLRVTFPPDPAGSTSTPVPVLGKMTAAFPNPSHLASRVLPSSAENEPQIMQVNGKAYDIDQSGEPWIVTFHLLGHARVRTCRDGDPVVSAQLAQPGDTMPLAKNQRLELFESMLSSWSVVSEADRCPATGGRAP